MTDTTDPQTGRTSAIYDAIDVFQRTHRLPGLQHAQIRGLLAEHLARTLPVAAPPAPADRSGLLDAAAQAIRDSNGSPEALEWWRTHPQLIPAHVYAPAVLSVLPPDGRAAVLLWAADQLDADMERFFSEWPDEPRNSPYALGRKDAATELRRLAAGERDEQQAQQECPLCSHLTCVGGKPCGVISTERGDLAEPCGCTGAEAQPPRHRWFVETRDGLADQWAPGTRYVDRRLALGRYAALNENHPTWKDGTPVERRIVRETTTFTVEQPAAAPVAGQPPADTGEEARS